MKEALKKLEVPKKSDKAPKLSLIILVFREQSKNNLICKIVVRSNYKFALEIESP